MIKDDIIRKQLSRGLEMPEKWASGKRQNRMVPQSSGLETLSYAAKKHDESMT